MRDSAYLEGVDYEAASALLRVLSSPVRLAVIRELASADRCVHELMGVVKLPQTQVSQHLRILREAGVVSRRRRGREVVYSLRDRQAAEIVDAVVGHPREHQWS